MDVVTGAFGFTGRYIARRLLSAGHTVRTLTNRPQVPEEFEGRIEALPYSFDDPASLVESLRGVTTLYNTYWIRFEHNGMTFDKAVQNSQVLIQAAKEAGVERIVHTSITNPSPDSDLPYFRGKALVERAVRESGLSYAILRPAVFFAPEGVLINNIAWFLRNLPVFAIPGKGDYPIQPTFIEDYAEMAVAQGELHENVVLAAVGPEVVTLEELVHLLARTVNSHAKIIHLPGSLALIGTWFLGAAKHDVVMTPDELTGLQRHLLKSDQPAIAPTKLSDWLAANADTIGREYLRDVR